MNTSNSLAEVEDVLSTAAAWRAAGEQVALATVTETWGSSPRPAGSGATGAIRFSDAEERHIVAEGCAWIVRKGLGRPEDLEHTESGGCIEGAVADAALKTMETGTPQLLDFGVTNERAWEVGLACGGKVKVFVERLL